MAEECWIVQPGAGILRTSECVCIRKFDEDEHLEFMPLKMIGILEAEEAMLGAVAERDNPSSISG
jgi:hypothetical protein